MTNEASPDSEKDKCTLTSPTPLTVSCGTDTTAAAIDETVPSVAACVRAIAVLWPFNALTCFLSMGTTTVTTMAAGNLIDSDALAAVAVGLSVINLVAIAPGTGLCCALDTLCAQEYGRDKNSRMIGYYTKISLALGVLFSCLAGLCVLLVVPPVLSRALPPKLARDVITALVPTVWYVLPVLAFMSLAKFCQAQCVPHIPTMAMGVGVIATPVATWFFLRSTPDRDSRMQLCLCAIAVVTWLQLCTALVLVLRNPQLRHTLGGPAFQLKAAPLWEYLRYGLPSVVFVGAESGAFQTMVIYSSSFGATAGDGYVCIGTTCAMMFTMTYGLSVAASARIGNALGSNRPLAARMYAHVALSLSAVTSCCNSLLFALWLYRWVIPLYTPDPAVFAVAKTLLPFVPVFHMLDCLQFMFQGIFSGCGRNHVGAVIILLTLVAVGVSMALALGSAAGLGLRGLLSGFIIGLLTETGTYFCYFRQLNLAELAAVAVSRGERVSLENRS